MAELPNHRSRRDEPVFAPLGGHEVAITGGSGLDDGDVVYLRVHGVVELTDLKLILDLLQRTADRHPQVFMIAHTVGPGGFSPEARRYYVNRRKIEPGRNRWVYVVGASTLVRTLVALVMRGTALITGQAPKIQLVATEEEALRLIAERRAQPG